jgi:hypothetical protein
MASRFSVVALIAAYNEADIIEQVVRDLVQQDIQIHFIDDGSTDGTAAAVERFVGHGVIAIERWARDEGGAFQWERILRRKEALASELDADWFIHHDADEFRESPWPDVGLKDAIRRVDALGYNAIDFESVDFQPTHDNFRPGDDIRRAFPFYSTRARYDGVQIKCWKRAESVDLASSGGHDAQFDGRRVFPLRFVLRHYPIRGQAHGERKVFQERRNRFVESERARGWHVQYDAFAEGTTFIRDCSTLTAYDPEAIRLQLLLRHRGVEGLERERAELEATLDRSTEEIAKSIADAARLRRDVETLQSAAVGQAAEAANLRRIVGEREAHVEIQRAEIADLKTTVARQSEEAVRWQATVDDLTARLVAFERSLSWRLTVPVRKILALFRGR